MKHDPSQSYLPPPKYRSRKDVIADWLAHYKQSHPGQKPSYGWLAMKSGVNRRTVIRIVQEIYSL